MKYKVGDRVKMRSLQWCNENIFNNEDKYPPEIFRGIEKFCGKILMISDAVDKSKYVDEGYYNMAEDTEWEYYWTDEMIEGLVEDETKSNIIEEAKTYWDSIKDAWICPEGYIFKDENGNVINATKIVLEKKKKEYPKTYEECCRVLNIAVCDLVILDNMLDTSEMVYRKNRDRLLNSFRKLLICRDAYWKIAGEEMGLGKPWEPDWKSLDPQYIILYQYGSIDKAETHGEGNYILAFPTEEMRDAFYENFKELIEICKELL